MGLSLSHGKTLDPGGHGIEALPPLGATPQASRLDPRLWFPVDRRGLPLELEIGSGKGTFLVQQAERLPEVNFLGVEYAKAFWRYAADRARRRALPNVRLLHADAAVFVAWHAPDAVFRQVHIYFPDPWPKKRHHKRRLIQDEFLRQLHRVLADGGMARLVTDHDGYFAWMADHAARAAGLFERLPFDRPVSAAEGEVVGTNFERKYRREGRPFNAMTLRRIGSRID
jgi:tRNA (guanine-N7-)-methyltransferase